MPPPRQSTTRLLGQLAAPFLLIAIGAPILGEQVDHHTATTGMFGLLIAVHNVLLAPLANRLETMVFAVDRRPWLAGRLTGWQRLILPYSTARVLTVGVSFGIGGAVCLLDASTRWNAFGVAAIVFCATGGALIGFGLSRLAVGLFVIRSSGLWSASRRTWLSAVAVIALGSLAAAAHSLITTLRLSPVL